MLVFLWSQRVKRKKKGPSTRPYSRIWLNPLHLGFHTFVLYIVVGFSVELVKTCPPEPQLMLV